MDTRTKEAIRYLGYGKSVVDERTLEMISDSMKELESVARAKSIYRIFELVGKRERIRNSKGFLQFQIGQMDITSRNLGRHLQECKEVILFAATLGTEVDRQIRCYSLTQIAKAVVLQACAAAYLEEYCDECQKKIAKELQKEGKWLRPRFSPGYGDFDIHYQENILQMLETSKQIGLSMTEGYMLLPSKSITAVIGISTTKEECRSKGCQICAKKDCIYRKNQRSIYNIK